MSTTTTQTDNLSARKEELLSLSEEMARLLGYEWSDHTWKWFKFKKGKRVYNKRYPPKFATSWKQSAKVVKWLRNRKIYHRTIEYVPGEMIGAIKPCQVRIGATSYYEYSADGDTMPEALCRAVRELVKARPELAGKAMEGGTTP